MKCPECGNDNTENAQFCGGCSVSLNVSVVSSSGAKTAELPMVSFTEAISRGFSNYFTFSVRATRAENWWWVLFTVLADVILSIVDILAGTYNAAISGGLLSRLFGLAVLIPSIALGARRLHDINRSGWWQLMYLASILIVPFVVLIGWAIKPSDRGPNKYGPDPRQATSQQPYKP